MGSLPFIQSGSSWAPNGINADFGLWGGGVWTSNDVTSSEPGAANTGFQVLKGGVTDWFIDAHGLEEGATMKLVRPPAGAHLSSAMGDFTGFVRTDSGCKHQCADVKLVLAGR